MAWENKVVWSEGLFLQPHHFQQSDRYTEALVAGLAARTGPYQWGVSQLELDDAMLKLGKVAVTSVSGLTPDGSVFRVPQTEMHPPALELPEDAKNAVIHLTVPIRRQGASEVDMTTVDESNSRWRATELEITDTMGRDRRPVTVAVGKLRLGLALDTDEHDDRLLIPIARVIEVRADKQVVLDTGFMASCLDIRAAPPLSAFLREIEGLLGHRMEVLAARLSEGGPTQGTAEIADFLLLQAVNRALPMVRHLLTIENVHPCAVYGLCVSLAGELATFMASSKSCPEFLPYRHHDLNAVFAPVMRALQQYLSAVLEQNAIAISLEPRRYGIHVGMIADRKLISNAQFILAAKADVPAEGLRRHFASQAKVGPVEEIRTLVNSALPGIGMTALPVAPRQLPYHSGSVYFELEPSSPLWSRMTTSGGIAIHVAGEYPGLALELWAIRKA